MSTPPVLSKSTGACSAYEPDCIGDIQQILFYIALVLLAVGIAGGAYSLACFLPEQFMDAMENISDRSMITACVGNVITFLITAAAVLGLPYVKPWSLRFGIPTIFLLVAIVIFLSGSSTYSHIGPQGSHLTMVLRVFVAFTSKLFCQRPADSNELYQKQLCTIPHTRNLRCLDKAAIVLPNQSLEEQQNDRWKLCSILEVEATKLIISLIPMSMSFLFLGLIFPLAFTFFLEQAKTMDHKVGSLTIPLAILLWFNVQAKDYFPKVYFTISSLLCGSISRIATSGIIASMVLAVLCCVTAAKVESRRLDMVTTHGLLDKPNEKVPMSVFWLLPQFILLGAVDGVFVQSLASFFSLYFTPTLNSYMVNLSHVVHGLGCFGSILLAYVVNNITEKEGKPGWFQATLNRSRLDNYFWLLSVVMVINLGLFLIMRLCYRCCSKEEQIKIV